MVIYKKGCPPDAWERLKMHANFLLGNLKRTRPSGRHMNKQKDNTVLN
jgi:hypothetical protein